MRRITRSAPAMMIFSWRQRDWAEGHKMRRIKMLPDKGDPSIVLVVKIEVRDRMNARLDGPDGDSPCPRGLDN